MSYITQKEFKSNGSLDSYLDCYIREISKKPLLKRKEEQELGKIIQDSEDEVERQKAINKLVEHNLKFVVKYARGIYNKYKDLGLGLELFDIIQAGNEGLIRAAQKFDYNKGVKFISYAWWWVDQRIRKCTIDQVGFVKLGSSGVNLLYALLKESTKIMHKTGQAPSINELAKKLNISQEEVVDILRASNKPLSLYEEIPGCDELILINTLKSKNSDIEAYLIKLSMSKVIEKLLKELREREEKIIRMRKGLGYPEPITLEKIAKEFNLTRERIRQIEKKTEENLKIIAKRKKLVDLLF